MKNAIVTIGAPASGKSTYARNLLKDKSKNYVIAERDILREVICIRENLLPNYKAGNDNFQEAFYNLNKKTRESVEKSVTDSINAMILSGDNLILSNTNLSKKQRNGLINNLKNNGYSVEIVVFNPTLISLLEHNEHRKDKVSENILYGLYVKLQHQIKELREDANITFDTDHINPTTHNCVIVDLDGTLAHIGTCDEGKPLRTFFDTDNVHTDDFDDVVFSMVRGVARDYDADIIFLTGRNSDCFQGTIEWLDDNLSFFGMSFDNGSYQLYSRMKMDYRKDYDIKRELYNTFIKDQYDVVAVFDDRPVCVNLWNDIGLKVVALGDQRISF